MATVLPEALSAWGNRDGGGHAFLGAEAAVLVFLTRFVTADARGDGNAHIIIPMPGYRLLVGVRSLFEDSTSALALVGEVQREIGLGQALGEHQPAVVGDD